jgi:integrase
MPKLSNSQITDHTVRNARPKDQRYEIRDSLLRGFMLRVNPSGTKSWYIQLDRNRKQKIADAAVLTASVARYRAKDILVRQSLTGGGLPGKARQLTLGEFLQGRYSQLKKRQSRYGQRDLRRLCAALGALLEERLEHLGLSKLERWRLKREGQVSPATVNRELSMLRTALDQACKWQLLLLNPAIEVKLRKVPPAGTPRFLTQAERQRLFTVLSGRNDRISTLLQLALNTGLRRNEIFSLRWKDVILGPNPSIIIQKSGKFQNANRKIALNKSAVSVLTTWQSERRNRTYLVFPGASGGQLKTVNTAWKRLMNEAGISHFSLNDCRNDFAVRLVKAKIPLAHVRDLLGHSSIALTERYAIFAPGKHQDAVACLDID